MQHNPNNNKELRKAVFIETYGWLMDARPTNFSWVLKWIYLRKGELNIDKYHPSPSCLAHNTGEALQGFSWTGGHGQMAAPERIYL